MGARTLVLGVGNLLRRDEGVGVHAARQLAAGEVPRGVEVLDGGTLGLELLAYLEGVERLLVIDCVETGAEPGAIFRFNPRSLPDWERQCRLSFHQVGILEALEAARLLGYTPEVTVFGVQPASLDWGMEPSPEVAAAIPRLLELIRQELAPTRA